MYLVSRIGRKADQKKKNIANAMIIRNKMLPRKL